MRYNSSNVTSIKSYEIGDDFILVEFYNGNLYLYTHHSCGESLVNTMKELAIANNGLNSFIKRNKPAFDDNTRNYTERTKELI